MAPEPVKAGGERGRDGEEAACRYLEAQGFRILERNWRCRAGEVDVVARDGPATVFVEVKDRGDASRGEGHEAVTWRKRRRIVSAARLYAASRGLSETPLRFDVVSIDRSDGAPRIRHDRDAFDASGA
jgi:putative endonuclease